MRNKFISTEIKKTEYYSGIQIKADLGVHEQAFDLFSKYVKANSTVLDIGAGAGAFSKRLHDAGYKVSALDIEESEWKAKEVEFLKLDINKGISASVNRVFDSLCCLEVIEHVENPWGLMRDMRNVLKTGGILLLSTPNITSFWSRVYFLRSGFYHQFMPYDLSYGHINPMSAYEIELIAKNTGCKLFQIQPGCYLPLFDFSEIKKLPLLFSNIFRWFFYLISKNYKTGWNLFFVLQKLDDKECVYTPGKLNF